MNHVIDVALACNSQCHQIHNLLEVKSKPLKAVVATNPVNQSIH